MALLPNHSRPRPSLKRPLWISAGLHVAAILLFFFAPSLSVFKPRTKVIWVQLPKGVSEEIDLKMKEAEMLPKTTIQEQKEWLKKPEEAKDKKMQAAKEEKPKLRPIQAEPKPKPKQLTAEQKALAALEKRMKAPPEAAQVPEKGEGFKYGTAMEPLRVPPSDPEYVAYQAKVRYKIIEEWILPLAYLEGEAPPRSKIIVQINPAGEIVSQTWEEKSGNAAFDSSCERAVQRASPLPLPPERLKWEAYNEGFLVEFDPRLKGG